MKTDRTNPASAQSSKWTDRETGSIRSFPAIQGTIAAGATTKADANVTSSFVCSMYVLQASRGPSSAMAHSSSTVGPQKGGMLQKFFQYARITDHEDRLPAFLSRPSGCSATSRKRVRNVSATTI